MNIIKSTVIWMFYVLFRFMRIPRNIALLKLYEGIKIRSLVTSFKQNIYAPVMSFPHGISWYRSRYTVIGSRLNADFFLLRYAHSEFTTLIRDSHIINCLPNNPFAPEIEITRFGRDMYLMIQWRFGRNTSRLRSSTFTTEYRSSSVTFGYDNAISASLQIERTEFKVYSEI